MDAAIFAKLTDTFRVLTPRMIDATLSQLRDDAALTARYSAGELREIAQQGVTSFRDVLLGALQFDHPRILGSELDWISRLMEGRGIDQATLRTFFGTMRDVMRDGLEPADFSAVDDVLSHAIAYIHPR